MMDEMKVAKEEVRQLYPGVYQAGQVYIRLLKSVDEAFELDWTYSQYIMSINLEDDYRSAFVKGCYWQFNKLGVYCGCHDGNCWKRWRVCSFEDPELVKKMKNVLDEVNKLLEADKIKR